MITLKPALPIFILCISLWQVAAAQLNVTINKKGTSTTSPVVFTAKFSAPINTATFTASDIVLSGTATGKAVTSITQVAPNDGTTFEISVTATSGTGTIIATIPAVGYVSAILGNTVPGTQPYNLTMDGSGNIYTSNYATNNVSKITTAGVSSILGTTESGPINIAIDNEGNLYTINYNANNVSMITPAGVSTIFGTTGSQPSDILIDEIGGYIYTSNYGSNDISKIPFVGGSIILGTTGGEPVSIVLDQNTGNVYTANSGDNNISMVTPSGVSTNLGTTGFNPTGMVIDASGNLYICNFGDNSISKITPAGVSTIFSTTGNGPTSIIMDVSGNLYTTNQGDNTVSQITPAGVSTIIGNTGAGPRGMLIDGSLNIYTANQSDNNVTKLTAVGIALSGSTTLSNQASTSTDNTFVLPVSLLYFTASNTQCTASLYWETSAEISSSYYSIERSTDGQVFTEIKKVASKNSVTGAAYAQTFTDVSGTTYYRLKMVDADGHYKYSKILTVTAEGNCASPVQLTVSPNPASDFITVAGLVTGSHISLINAAGTRLTGIEATSSSQRIDISAFAKGIYILRIEATDGSIHIVKFIK